MPYKINIPLVGGDGTRPVEVIDSAGNMTIDEIQTKFDIVKAFQGNEKGYHVGGIATTSPMTHFIEKFPFSSDANSVSNGGDLTQARYFGAGQQV